MKCPREYFYNYIFKLRVKPNIHLVKGSVVHKVLEDFYKNFQLKPKIWMKQHFRNTWKKNKKLLDTLDLSFIELIKAKRDCYNMLKSYLAKHLEQQNILLEIGKAQTEKHAFFLVKPKFREMWVADEEIHCGGFIDRVNVDYDGNITLGDYKTSSKYGIGLPEAYKRQLGIYALLYNNVKKEMPSFVSVIFLRYGEEYILEVTPSILQYARDAIDYVWQRSRSTDKKDYPKHESNLCRWCQFRNVCNGDIEFKAKKRQKKTLGEKI